MSVQTQSTLEDTFSAWIEPLSSVKAPIVLVGAGLSFGLAPTADRLGLEIGGKRGEIEKALGVSANITPIDAQTLYQWAGECISELVKGGSSLKDAKVRLAGAMGITTDQRFLALTNVPIRGTTPRHRVLSRLAREGRVDSFWSFNWDCWLESGFEAVGMRAGERSSESLVAPDHWKLRYKVWFSGASDAEKNDTLPIFKAHGCAKAISRGQGEFVVTQEEMALDLSMQPPKRTKRMEVNVQARWTVAIGWSATELYVKQLLEKLKPEGMLGAKLTIIDVAPYQPGHLELYASYSVDPAAGGVCVAKEYPGTTDDLFSWIQTRRGLSALELVVFGVPDVEAIISTLVSDTPPHDHNDFSKFWPVSFIDSWLPVWLRTCFLVGAQDHMPAGGADFEVLPIEQRDAHISWVPSSYVRHDLVSAAIVAKRLHELSQSAGWDFNQFPGAFWAPSTQALALPVPFWTHPDRISAMSLRAIVDSMHWHGKGKIRRVILVLVSNPSAATIADDAIQARTELWKEAVAAVFTNGHFAGSGNIEALHLDRLLEPFAMENLA